MAISSKRAEYTALTGLILSVAFFLIAFLLGRWSGFYAISELAWFVLSTVFVWFVLWLQFHQITLAEQEKLDMSQLAQADEKTKIFRAEGEHTSLFAVAQKRLKLIEKWFIPVFAALIAAYQISIGSFLLNAVMQGIERQQIQPLICAVCMTAIAFVSFLISRYATGMSSQPHYKALRAGGSLLLALALFCFLMAIGLALVQFELFFLLKTLSFAIPVLLVILGIETALNVILDIYRPRLKGQYSRSAFDSRLLGTINEPGGIFRTLAGAIDYQFGFKVSETWFYKLLEKAILPLLLFALFILYFLSCFIIVAPNEQAVIEHFGNPVTAFGDVRIVEPGMALKWPWPIDIAYKYPTKKVLEISIGFVPKIYEKGQKRDALLWGKAHHQKEHVLLVASESTQIGTGAEAVPVSLLIASVPVQYKIKDLYLFLYNHSDSEQLLEAICYRELTRFAASATIEVDQQPGIGDDNLSLLGAGRIHAKEFLTKRIQELADDQKLGVEILFLGLQGIHPPPEVAAGYQNVVGAVQKKQALILNAYAERNKTLTEIAGSVEDADNLYNLAAQYQQAKEQKDAKQIKKAAENLDTAFQQAKGDIFKTLREAESYAFEKTTLAKATGKRFASQLKAYRAAKDIYKTEQRLLTFEEALKNVRKYVVVADSNDTQVFIIDVKEKLTPSLYDIGSFQESEK